MASQAMPTKRRLQVLIKESACPGLIANLSQLPEGDENVFIRAVLTEWFLANANSEESASRLVDLYRVTEFRNANGIRSPDYLEVRLPAPSKAQPSAREVEKALPVKRSLSYADSLDGTPTAQVLPAEVHSPEAAAVERRPPMPQAPAVPAFDSDFDPDMF